MAIGRDDYRYRARCLVRRHRRALAVAVLLSLPLLSGEAMAADMAADMAAAEPLIIAHRGASAYLPEHTLPAKAVAHAQGADFIEQDVVLSRDGVPVVLHDIHLEATTNVAERFPARARDDARFYAIDFSLEELKALRVHERRGPGGQVVFPGRFPAGAGLFEIPTLAEEIALIEGMNRSTGREVGLYIEMKASAFHRREGRDLPRAVLEALAQAGWAERRERVFLQSFEPEALRYLKHELNTPLPLIQLIGEVEEPGPDFEYLRSDAGLADIATYADGIGPGLMQLYRGVDERGKPRLTDLAAKARALGLAVHPYTFRAEQLPPGIASFEALHRVFFRELGVDGIFTDFPDRSRAFRDTLRKDAPPAP